MTRCIKRSFTSTRSIHVLNILIQPLTQFLSESVLFSHPYEIKFWLSLSRNILRLNWLLTSRVSTEVNPATEVNTATKVNLAIADSRIPEQNSAEIPITSERLDQIINKMDLPHVLRDYLILFLCFYIFFLEFGHKFLLSAQNKLSHFYMQ